MTEPLDPHREGKRGFWIGVAVAAVVVGFMLWAGQTERFGPYERFWSFLYGTSGLAVISAFLAITQRQWLLWLLAVLLLLPMLGYIFIVILVGLRT